VTRVAGAPARQCHFPIQPFVAYGSGMNSSWDRPDGNRLHDHARLSRPQNELVARPEPSADDHWLEEGLELRRARRKRLDTADDEG
jgi:hypothetical protein